jgi:transposase-like protein
MRDYSPADKGRFARQAVALQADGASLGRAADTLGVPLGTLARWVAAWRNGGADAFASRRASCGRKAVARGVSPEFAARLRGLAAKCHSAVLALRQAADWPDCPPAMRADLKRRFAKGGKIHLPLSLRRLCNVTPEAEAKRMSDTAFGHVAIKARHVAEVRDPFTGEIRPLRAGDLFLSDDMSVNHPYWFSLPEGETATRAHRGDRLAEKWGVAVGRQGLYTIDARGKWLGVDLTGRPTDAYTAADVLRHFRHVVAAFGLPRIGWVLEKGVWCARTVDGIRVAATDDGMRTAIVAGLESLGIEVKHVWTSEGKALIEGAFGNLQNFLDLQDAPTVGRHRGEMERVEAAMRRVRAGVVHPREAGLPHIAEELEAVRSAMKRCNETPKAGRIQEGIPDERWEADTALFPLRRPAGKEWGVFFPLKREVALRQGHAEVSVDGRTLRFTAPELFAELGAGYRVLVACDPDDPEAGAAVYNLERGARNVRGFRFGEWMAAAEFSRDMLLWGRDDEAREEHAARKRRFTRAFQTAWATTGLWETGVRRGVERPGERLTVEAGRAPLVGAANATDATSASLPTAARSRRLSDEDCDALEEALAAKEAAAFAAGDLIGI